MEAISTGRSAPRFFTESAGPEGEYSSMGLQGTPDGGGLTGEAAPHSASSTAADTSQFVLKTGDTMTGALGAGDTTTIGTVGFVANASNHPSGSKRASIIVGNYQIGQDLNIDGTKDFYLYSFDRNSVPIRIDTNDVMALSQRPTFAGAVPWDSANFTPSGGPAYIDLYAKFGVRADGTDQSGKINAALSFLGSLIQARGWAGGIAVLPPGRIVISNTLTIPSGVHLKGAGRNITWLRATMNAPAVYVGPSTLFATASDFSVAFADEDADAPASFDATCFKICGNNGNYYNIGGYMCGVFFYAYGGNNNLILNFIGNMYRMGGILNEGLTTQNPDGSYKGAIDNFFVQGRLECYNTTDWAQYGSVRCINNCEGFNLDHVNCLGGRYGLITDSVANVHGRRPQFMTFSNSMFDSHEQGSLLENSNAIRFSQCWFAGSGVHVPTADKPGHNPNHIPYPGLRIGGGCKDITLVSGWVNSHSGPGVLVVNGATDISFVGVTFAAVGLFGDANCIDCYGGYVIINSCRFYHDLAGIGDGYPGGTYNVVVRGSANNVIMSGNISRGCQHAQQSTNNIVYDNNLGSWTNP
ncbi:MULTISPECIES: glycoside hydrolase family 55 protein [Methylobacterium]|uniref:Pectate lyase superfamily protein domain-containing protein n=2 Tax=Pseudomonadota TaxID=1224 RepID=A0ABQ4SV51_9HYPH|nr:MULTISPECIES: glycoside hydrolase family 55 protein [Methylobacterium]GBU18806.1 hypothetical protein AwMethylo_30210 [Methylobacterium sp.]GJE07080.1 hypothetical protein AOPFMNJM_2404 [Methylobacterium jeotgali]